MAKKVSKIKGLNILLGVSGGIAAYKALDLASKLTAAGANVNTVMTASAGELVGAKSFEALTHRQVRDSLWGRDNNYHISHIEMAETADVVVVAPATANIIGKAANGICDDLLSTTLCACWQRPVLFVPAMNEKMWLNPAVKWNVKTLGEMGFEIVGPVKGRLACGDDAVGRMVAPAEIIKRIEKTAAGLKIVSR